MKSKLVPYAVILAAKGGDAIAMEHILTHYDRLITYYSRRAFYDEYGNRYTVVDNEIKERIQAKLMYQIVFNFDPTRMPEKKERAQNAED